MFNSVSSVSLWAIGLDGMFECIESILNRGITNSVDRDLEVESIGKVDNGEKLGRGPDGSWSRAIGIGLGQESGASVYQPP